MSTDGGKSAVKRFEELSSQVGRRWLPHWRGQQRPPAARHRMCCWPAAPTASRRHACLPPCVPLQWQQYERKFSERGSEQHSALAKSAGLLDSMRKRFGTPGGGDLLATPRADLAGPRGGLIPAHTASSAVAAGLDTPRCSSGASLKENFGAELNRSGATTTTLFNAPQQPAPMSAAATPASTGSFAAAAAAAMAAGGGGPGGDSMLQQASNLFLQQVEDMRRKYTAEVERLKVGAAACRVHALQARVPLSCTI